MWHSSTWILKRVPENQEYCYDGNIIDSCADPVILQEAQSKMRSGLFGPGYDRANYYMNKEEKKKWDCQ
ncbi:MAG: hypothetical protein AB4352_27830 [Hormoscilla sp.]